MTKLKTVEAFEEALSPLEFAKSHWKNGLPLPADIAVKLMAIGYDVPRLEAKYSL